MTLLDITEQGKRSVGEKYQSCSLFAYHSSTQSILSQMWTKQAS